MKYSNKQQTFIDSVESGKNVFLSGKAGTGKSFITKEAIRKLEQAGRNVIAIAPTGVAANNIGGSTIHSTFGLSPFGVLTFETCNFLKSSKRDVLKKTNVIFIDEVSMLRPDILDALNWTLIKNGIRNLAEFQVIFVGDMKQLGIVADDNMKSMLLKNYDGTTFMHSIVFPELDVEIIELDEILRQSDTEFIEALNEVREGRKSPYFRKFSNLNKDGIVLAPHNSTVQKYNSEGLAALSGKQYTFNAILDGKIKETDFNVDVQIKVKDGAKIMYLVNSKNNNLFNGTLGIFRTDGTKFMIEVGEECFALEKHVFCKKEYVLSKITNRLELQETGSITQYPFKLAYALSIHKSQGLTFNECSIDLTLPCFAEGQLYVALSRVKTPEGLSIIHR